MKELIKGQAGNFGSEHVLKHLNKLTRVLAWATIIKMPQIRQFRQQTFIS